MGGGQMVAADFIMTPAVVFSENNAGGMGGALGGLFGGRGSAIGAVVGGLKFKEAQTSMLVADARSGVQVAAAEGSSKKADLSLGALVFGGGAGGGVGGYGNTNEGKIVAASFADNYNNIVRVIRNDPSLQRDVGTLAQEAAAGGSTKAGAVFNEGDVLVSEDRRREAAGQRGRGRQGRRDARQERRADLHGRGAERLPQGRVRQRQRLGQEDPGLEVGWSRSRIARARADWRARATCLQFRRCGCSSMVELQLPKLLTWVRFPSPAPSII